MDEMKIRSEFLKGIISKIIRKTIKRKTGYDIDFRLDDFKVVNSDEKARVFLSIEADISREQLVQIITKSGLTD